MRSWRWARREPVTGKQMPKLPMPNQAPVQMLNRSVVSKWLYPDGSQPCPSCADVAMEWYDLPPYRADGEYETRPLRSGPDQYNICPVCGIEGDVDDWFLYESGWALQGNFIPDGFSLDQGWDVMRAEWLERRGWDEQAVRRICTGHHINRADLISFGKEYRTRCAEQDVLVRVGMKKIPVGDASALDSRIQESSEDGWKSYSLDCYGLQLTVRLHPAGQHACIVCGCNEVKELEFADAGYQIDRLGVRDAREIGAVRLTCKRCQGLFRNDYVELVDGDATTRLPSMSLVEAIPVARSIWLDSPGWLPQKLAVIETGLGIQAADVKREWERTRELFEEHRKPYPPQLKAHWKALGQTPLTEAHWQHALHPGGSSDG